LAEIFSKATSKESASKVTYMISDKDISVVVQGPIHTQDNLTKRVLESVRTHLPNAELILSTWKGSKVDGLDCDILLLNDDPGAINSRNNVNRQIVSTRNGLQKATRTYAVKLRTDTQLTGTGFIDAFDKYPERREDFKVFERKIVIPTIHTRNPFELSNAHFFHPSDIFHFGLKSDMLLLWNIPMATELDVKNLVPEQYIWLNALKSMSWNINLSELHLKEKFRLSEISLVNNFIVDTPRNLDLLLPERLMGFCSSCYSISQIEQIIERYITKNLNSLPISSLLKLPVFLFWQFSSRLQLNLGIKQFLINLSEKRRRDQVI
jgi:hypothetical protein